MCVCFLRKGTWKKCLSCIKLKRTKLEIGLEVMFLCGLAFTSTCICPEMTLTRDPLYKGEWPPPPPRKTGNMPLFCMVSSISYIQFNIHSPNFNVFHFASPGFGSSQNNSGCFWSWRPTSCTCKKWFIYPYPTRNPKYTSDDLRTQREDFRTRIS